MARTGFGEKAFGRWAPKVLKAIAEDAVFDQCEEGPHQQWQEDTAPSSGRQPPDEWAAVRNGWRGHLRHKFAEHQRVDDASGAVTVAAGGRSVQRDDGTVLVWTDGGSKIVGPSRIASAAAFYGTDNSENASWPVPGKQTAVRAELFALLQVLRRDDRPVSIRTDCRIVAAGVNIWRQQWKAAAWFRSPLRGQTIPHADLWKEVDGLLTKREQPWEVRWTKGHPLPRHLWQGVTTELDAWGNYAVDEMATEAIRTQVEGKRRGAPARHPADVPRKPREE